MEIGYPVTKRQKRLLESLRKLTAESGGIAPSFEELAAELGVTHAAVRTMARNLAERGHVRWMPKKQRTLQIIEDKAAMSNRDTGVASEVAA